MAKLQGLVGVTANPNLVTKDLQMTVRKLDGLVAANEQRAQASPSLSPTLPDPNPNPP